MNDVPSPTQFAAQRSAVSGLAPLVAIVFCGFLVVGAPLPALSLYVHDELGFSGFTVGWVIGIQSVVTVLSRHFAGTLSDHHGPRWIVLRGLPLAVLAAGCYLASALLPAAPEVRLAVLIAGRVLLGLAESLFITGTMSWGIGRIGVARTGRVMSWQGIAMYAAFGLGAPLGLAVHSAFGFAGVAVLAIATPLIAIAVAFVLPPVPVVSGDRVHVPVHRVLRLIWLPGLVLALATVPFASMTAFLPLAYSVKNWAGAGVAIASFGVAYVFVRLVGSHLPDRFGPVRVVAASLAIELIGQLVLWCAPSPVVALFGAALTGLGFSLVFPAMGVMATLRVPAEMRGRAVGNFIAFFDVAVGLTGPLVGLLTGAMGYAAAFVAGAMASAAGLALMPMVRRYGRANPHAGRGG
ncbi:MAG: MFS transporter [Xanthobacteraceae bacterium]